MDGKGLMKLESEQQEKETGGVARSTVKGKKSKAKAEGPTKPKAYTPLSPSKFCLRPIGV